MRFVTTQEYRSENSPSTLELGESAIFTLYHDDQTSFKWSVKHISTYAAIRKESNGASILKPGGVVNSDDSSIPTKYTRAGQL